MRDTVVVGERLAPAKEVHELSVTQLHENCSAEIEKFRRGKKGDSVHCFELFRRAFAERDEEAWEAVHNGFHGQVERWIRKHPAHPNAEEEVQYFVNRVFEKMWSAITPEKFNRILNFASLLAYLKTCVASVLLDFQRKKRVTQANIEDQNQQDTHLQTPKTEAVVLEEFENKELWRLCKKLMNSRQEQIVLFASFTLMMKPREIYQEYSEQFVDIDQVYRTKENILARLRRSPELSELIGAQTGEKRMSSVNPSEEAND